MQKDEKTENEAKPIRFMGFSYHFVIYLLILAILFVVDGMRGALIWVGLSWVFAIVSYGVYVYFLARQAKK